MAEDAQMMWIASAADVQAKEILEKAAKTKESDEFVKKSRQVAASIGKDAAGTWNRPMEVIEFARRMGYRKLGIAFCAGLTQEAKTMADALASHGFQVCGVACSVEGPCNSVGQAMLLNDAGTELNIMMGLCVGHDATFIKFSDAPVTPLAIKDKVTCHNPVAALTCNYQKKRLAGE